MNQKDILMLPAIVDPDYDEGPPKKRFKCYRSDDPPISMELTAQSMRRQSIPSYVHVPKLQSRIMQAVFTKSELPCDKRNGTSPSDRQEKQLQQNMISPLGGRRRPCFLPKVSLPAGRPLEAPPKLPSFNTEKISTSLSIDKRLTHAKTLLSLQLNE